MVTTTLTKWGNGQGVRLTKTVMEQSGLHLNEKLEVVVHEGSITLTPLRQAVITIPDFDALFADYDGPQPQEDGFSYPMGGEL